MREPGGEHQSGDTLQLGLVQVFDNEGAVKYKVTPFANYTDGVFVTRPWPCRTQP